MPPGLQRLPECPSVVKTGHTVHVQMSMPNLNMKTGHTVHVQMSMPNLNMMTGHTVHVQMSMPNLCGEDWTHSACADVHAKPQHAGYATSRRAVQLWLS